jgi:aminopeptidase N
MAALFLGVSQAFLCAQEPAPDFLNAEIRIAPDPYKESIRGEVRYLFKVPPGLDSVILDAHNMKFDRVALNGSPAAFRNAGGKFGFRAPEGQRVHELVISYTALPKQTVYFIGWNDAIEGNEQIWTQGQGKNSSHWVPVVDAMGDKVVFDLSIRMDTTYQVIANGLGKKRLLPEGQAQWDFEMEQPMSSYLLAFAIGRYDHLEERSSSGVPLRLYYPRGEREKAHWTYLHSAGIFDFLEAEIGVPYPWQDYKQVPVSDFLYAGMENTAATFFSDRYLVDSLGFNDENYVNINAHELAHQWFGNLVTEADGAHHWLHEGFATFYAYRADGFLFGPSCAHWKLYETARVLADMDRDGKGESLLDPGAGSLTFYEKGAWALFALREELGQENFDRGVREFLTTHAYATGTVPGFLSIMESVSGTSLQGFKTTWLESRQFPLEAAMAYLESQEEEIAKFLAASGEIRTWILPNEGRFLEFWASDPGPQYRAHLLKALGAATTRRIWEQAAAEESLEIQKALLDLPGEMKPWMQPYLENWLDAPSYTLRENALFKLWAGDVENRPSYLDRLASNGSLASVRLRQLWLLLAVLTPEYQTPERRQEYLAALRATTAPGNSWETRQNALAMLHQVGALNSNNIRDLMEATEHHSWQFRKFSRTLLGEVVSQNPGAVDWAALARPYPREKYPYLYKLIEDQ